MAPNTRQAARRAGRGRMTSRSLNRASTSRNADHVSMDVDEPQIQLKTGDGKRFTLAKSVLSCSKTMRTMIESSPRFENLPNECINLDFVDGQTLEKVVEWQRSNSSRADTQDATCMPQCQTELSSHDKSFLESMPEEELLKLAHATNYLNIEQLYNACCRYIANKWQGKTVEEIRRTYGIANDYRTEEENQLKLEVTQLGIQP